ncbi:holin, partial [Shigella flexneri]|nr:holin [Shigella flexneri]EHF3760054.1 holin [Escherichia coli]EAA1750089.1 holin [Shigella flexneri]EFV9572105.1 holin [Shigella flexneri]EFW6952737.1 holin [Shigella flexneri]
MAFFLSDSTGLSGGRDMYQMEKIST